MICLENALTNICLKKGHSPAQTKNSLCFHPTSFYEIRIFLDQPKKYVSKKAHQICIALDGRPET